MLPMGQFAKCENDHLKVAGSSPAFSTNMREPHIHPAVKWERNIWYLAYGQGQHYFCLPIMSAGGAMLHRECIW